MATPPTAIHPAFREGFDINAPVVRDSNSTTMSPFMHPSGVTLPSPPILLPADCFEAFPTERGFIEDKREQIQHQNSGSDTERTPVFIPTPNIESSEFSRSASYATPKKVSVRERATAIEQTKTPKKSILEKLRFTTPRSSTPSLSTSRGYGVYGGGEDLPPKAKAVLGDSPHKSNLTRAPSKRKGLFSFGASERPSLETHKSSPTYTTSEPRSAGARTVSFADQTGKTPQTAHTSYSDPMYDRPYVSHMQSQRARSPANTDHVGRKLQDQNKDGSACGVSRSRSLQYIDRTMPPTPPAKNTPPHEKESRAQQEARLQVESRKILEHHQWVSEQRRLEIMRNTAQKKEMVQTPKSKMKSPLRDDMFDDDTPTRETAKLVGIDGRFSPTKTGGYGRKELPKLVKQPSVYSLHASFYPDLDDQYSFEEMKKRADGLGLEGLSQLPESFYNCDPKVSYSPSLYSDDFPTRPTGMQSSPSTLHQMDIAKHSPLSPSPLAVHEKFRPLPTKGSLSEKPSASSEGTIPLVYPDLASDPSRSDLRESLQAHHGSTSEIELPVHSRKQSPARMQSTSRGQSPSRGKPPSRSDSPHKSALEVMAKSLKEEDAPASPPSFSCPSAMPSPLHFLPTTTYTPQHGLKVNTDISPVSPSSTSARTLTPSRSRGRIETFKSTGSPIAHISTSPFDKLPTLSPSIKPKFETLSPTAESDKHPEPQKQDHSPSSGSNTIIPTEVQDDQEDGPQQGPETKQESLARRIREQNAEIVRLQAEAQVFRDQIAEIEKERQAEPKYNDLPGETRADAIKRQIYEQLAEIRVAKAENRELSERISKYKRHLEGLADSNGVPFTGFGEVEEYTMSASERAAKKASVSEQAKENPSVSQHAEKDANTSELAELLKNPAIAPFIQEGNLAEMDLLRRMNQRRADQEYSEEELRHLKRHTLAYKDREGPLDAPSMRDIYGIVQMLTDQVRELQAARGEKD